MRTITSWANQTINQIISILSKIFPSNRLISKDKTFTALFPKNAKIVRIATGFQFTEGPIWCSHENCLLFSDIPANKIFKLVINDHLEVFRHPSNHANGLTQDKQGRLIVCEHATRRLTRTENDGSITLLADKFQGRNPNSPNDVIVKSDDSIYFTDPPYGIKPEQQEQPIQGVYRLSPDSQQIVIVADDFAKPNGLAFSPDEKQLYIDDSERCHIRVFDVQSDGMLTNDRIFCEMKVNKPGVPDGMKVDQQGNLYCAGGGGVWVFSPQGIHLGTIVTPEVPSNCAWGDEDYRSLYITASTSVYRIRINIPGINVSS